MTLSENPRIPGTRTIRQKPLSRDSGMSLYAQVRDMLREEVLELRPEVLIPTEAELEKRFDVSRITIRKAIDDLVTEGFLIRRQGKGTFTQSRKLTHDLNAVTSWTEQLQILGFNPHTSSIKIMEIQATQEIADFLKLKLDDPVMMLSRLRLVDNQPLSVMLNYLPAYLVPGFAKKMAKHESLYELLETVYGLVPSLAVDTVETRIATKDEAQRLKLGQKSPVLCVERICYLEDGTPLEVAKVTSRGDRYQYRVSLKGRARLRRS